jgi:hypothetical protein
MNLWSMNCGNSNPSAIYSTENDIYMKEASELFEIERFI